MRSFSTHRKLLRLCPFLICTGREIQIVNIHPKKGSTLFYGQLEGRTLRMEVKNTRRHAQFQTSERRFCRPCLLWNNREAIPVNSSRKFPYMEGDKHEARGLKS